MNKNIGFIYSRYYPQGGGVANATKNFAEALAKDGNDVTVYTIIPFRSNLLKNEIINEVKVRRFKIVGFIFKLLSFGRKNFHLKLLASWIGIKVYLEKRQHDLIFGHNIQWGGIFAVIIGIINKIPSAAMAHGEDVNQLEGNKEKETMTVFSMNNLDFIFSTNSDFTKILSKYSNRPIKGLPNIFHGNNEILEEELISKRFNYGALKLICIGRLDCFGKDKIEIKGFSIVLEAMKSLSNEISLEIIGEGPLFDTYDKYIKKQRLENRVALLGQISFPDVQKKLNACSVVLLPSNIEGLSMVMLEAMSKGIPLIATNIAGAKDYISDGENGMLIEPKNLEQLIEKIKAISKDFSLYTKMSLESKRTFDSNFTENAVRNVLYKHLNW